MPQRIVVVGHSALTCLGRDLDTTWRGLIAGRSGLRRHAALAPSRSCRTWRAWSRGLGPVPPGRIRRSRSSPGARCTWPWRPRGKPGPAAPWGLADLDPERVAVIVGSALGGIDLLDAEMARMRQRRSLAASPYLIPGLIINQTAGQIAQHLGFHGPRPHRLMPAFGGARDCPGGDVSPCGRGRPGPLPAPGKAPSRRRSSMGSPR